MNHHHQRSTCDTALGAITWITRDVVLVALGFSDRFAATEARLAARYPHVLVEPVEDAGGVGAALRAYLAGDVAALDAIPVDPAGTPFQRAVWSALERVAAGGTISYGALAAQVGAPRAVRAVGAANARNPIAIRIPCHRVIGADGTLTGYAGGLERKRWLLAHEAPAA